MDWFNAATGRNARPFDPAALLKFSNLDPRVQQHLTRVYAVLTGALVVAAAGAAVDVALHISGVLTTLAAFGSLAWLAFTPAQACNQTKRLALLNAFAFASGAGLGPLVAAALAVNPGILLTTLLSTAAIFASFSLSALVTQRRSYLFLGGLLSSAITTMLLMRMGGWLFGFGRFAYQLELYGGLVVFAGYVLFDTQLIVERASAGDFDVVTAALDLFTDFIAMAVRILIILLRNAERKQQEEQRRRKRS